MTKEEAETLVATVQAQALLQIGRPLSISAEGVSKSYGSAQEGVLALEGMLRVEKARRELYEAPFMVAGTWRG